MLRQVNKSEAIMIATRFFGQYNSDISLKNAVLEGDAWKVTVRTGMTNTKTRQVTIDANNGKILNNIQF
jgi:uncharacterized membrane protein YkoI